MKLLKSLSCICMILGLLVTLTGCPKSAHTGDDDHSSDTSSAQPLGRVYFTFFDTVSYIYSYAGDSQETFDAHSAAASSLLSTYHNLFDIYYPHAGVVGIYDINQKAGDGEWLTVDPALIDFLLYAKDLYDKTDGEMNIMMGAVLRLWHDSREQGTSLPDPAALTEAARHIDINSLEINADNNTVRITDPAASLDVGALGKGYATEMAAQLLLSRGATSYVLNIGGNIRIVGYKPDGSGWMTGIKNPSDTSTFSQYITLANTSCVTSGNYERYYTVAGKRYHHIIDKDTLYPSEYFASISVITENSGLADALSTALFCMSYEDGLALLSRFDTSIEVLWIDNNGTQYMTPGFSALVTENH